jgi:uncharacterized membrane protein YfcA
MTPLSPGKQETLLARLPGGEFSGFRHHADLLCRSAAARTRASAGARRTKSKHLCPRVAEGLIPVLIGAVAGIGGAFGFARVISSLLFQVSPYNPFIVSAAVLLLVTVGGAACLLPAHRAAEVDPMQALRSE